MLAQLCANHLIEKTRYRIEIDQFVWEVDEFHGQNSGLIVAKIELSFETQSFFKPNWIGNETSADHRYANTNLISAQFDTWKHESAT